jgi:hypothetical protein
LDERNKTLAAGEILRTRDDLPAKEREAIVARLKLHPSFARASANPYDLRTQEIAERSWRAALAIDDPVARFDRLMPLAHFWAQRYGRPAMEAIVALEDPALREQLVGFGIRGWANTSPGDAVEWVMSRPPSPERARILALSLGTLATADPRLAVERTAELSGTEHAHVFQQVVAHWTSVDAAAATAWAGSLREPSERGAALHAIAPVYAAQSAPDALRWAASLRPEEATVFVEQIVSQVAAADPVRASNMADAMSDTKLREIASATAFGAWAAYDADAALARIAQMDSPRLRDTAALAIVRNPRVDADAAERAYDSINDPGLKQQAGSSLYYRWSQTDPRRAERFGPDVGVQ